jgi:hypothetical protein
MSNLVLGYIGPEIAAPLLSLAAAGFGVMLIFAKSIFRRVYRGVLELVSTKETH